MTTRFYCLSQGSRFHDGKDGDHYLVYEKISKSQGKVVEQHGFERMLGGIKKFGPYHKVWSYKN